MKRIRGNDLSRRAMICQTALASGLGAIFAASASGQRGGAGGPWPHFNVDGVWVNERTSDY